MGTRTLRLYGVDAQDVNPNSPGDVAAWANDLLGPAWANGDAWHVVAMAPVGAAFDESGAQPGQPIALEVQFSESLWDKVADPTRRLAVLWLGQGGLEQVILAPKSVGEVLPDVIDQISSAYKDAGGYFVVLSDKEIETSTRAHPAKWQPSGVNLTPLGAGIGALVGVVLVVAVAYLFLMSPKKG